MTASRLDHLLDDPASIQSLDPSGMLSQVSELGHQLGEGFELGRSASDRTADGVQAVVVCGMGGSGITGDVLRAAFAGTLRVPLVVSKGYRIPQFCGPDTLVVAVSFSGNTEETIAAYGDAASRGARMAVIASGGELVARAKGDGAMVVTVPANVLAPRGALGYLVGAGIGLLERTELFAGTAGDSAGAQVEQGAQTLNGLAGRLGPDVPADGNSAKDLATWLRGVTPFVWGTEGVAEAAALRWKAQLNENAKTPAFAATVPELDHNEVEAWSGGGGDRFRIVALRSDSEPQAIPARVPATFTAMAAAGLESREVWSEGPTPLEQVLSLVMLGDFVSVYLAILGGIDPTPLPVLSELKRKRSAR